MFNDIFQKALNSGLQMSGIHLSEMQNRLMTRHAVELVKWNKKMNLTAITQPQEMAEKHYIDSILGSRGVSNCSKVLDIGSGGGFPGIVLKILYPDLNLFLLDASRKKISFLKHVTRSLDLKKIDVIHGRAEALCLNQAFTKQFDVVISRAFSSLAQFVEMGIPFLSPKGFLLALKGKNYQKELETLSPDLFHITQDCYTLPHTDVRRHIIKIKPHN